jgi:hypothetical protein
VLEVARTPRTEQCARPARSLLARPSPPRRGSVLRLSSARVDRVVSASTWCFAGAPRG